MTDSDTNQNTLDAEHIDWLVKHRADNQVASARLYRLMKENRNEILKDRRLASSAETLVSVSFSLWRSAFLSDKTNSGEAVFDSAINFLQDILINNAIAYPQERKGKDWTYNYYAHNALLRLLNLQKEWPKSKIGSILEEKEKNSPKDKWEKLQRAFEAGVDFLELRVTPEKLRDTEMSN